MAFSDEGARLAVQRFMQSTNYSWRSEVELKGGPTQEIPVVEGKFHSQKGWIAETMAGKQTIQAAGRVERRIANLGDGWVEIAQLSGNDDAKVRARELLTTALPHEELLLLSETSNSLASSGDGAFVAPLNGGTARLLLLSAARQRAPENMEKVLKAAEGELRVWVEEGRLIQYEIVIRANFSMGLLKRSVERTATTRLRNLGETELEFLDEAKSALGTRIEL